MKEERAVGAAQRIVTLMATKYQTCDVTVTFEGGAGDDQDKWPTDEIKWKVDIRVYYVNGAPVVPCDCGSENPGSPDSSDVQ